MNSIDLEKLIPSRAVRERCILEGRVFDLREQATLVWNNPQLSYRGRLELLEEIRNEAEKDSQWKELKKQIEESLDNTLFPVELNKAVMAAYDFSTKMTESECVAEVFKLYEKLTEKGK